MARKKPSAPLNTVLRPRSALEGSSAILLLPYERQQDAQHVSTLISCSVFHQPAVDEEAYLREIVLRELAQLHSNQPGTNLTRRSVYNAIKPLYRDDCAHDYYQDANTFGAFALRRPQQLGSMWPYIIAPSPSLVMIGEYASNHHAWVVGPLESAAHGVNGWLSQNNSPGAREAADTMASWVPPTSQNLFGELLPFASMHQGQWQANFGLLHDEKFRHDLAKRKRGGKWSSFIVSIHGREMGSNVLGETDRLSITRVK